MTGTLLPSAPRSVLRTAAAGVQPVLLPRIAVWALLVWVLSFTYADPDLWGHVRFGQDILSARSVQSVDPYSFTSDRPWVNHEWLAELLMAAAFNAAGPPALVIFKTVLLLAAFALASVELRRRAVPALPRDMLVACAVVACLTLTKTFRPQTFSLVLFAHLVWAVRSGEDGAPFWMWTVPPAMALWANLHGGWLVGAGVLTLWGGWRILVPVGMSRAGWLTTCVAAACATLATPEGWGLWQFLWETVGLGRADISEWQPITHQPPSAAFPWLFITPIAVVSLARMRARSPIHSLVIVVLAVLAFKVMRLVNFYALATIMLGGPHLLSPRQSKPTARPPTGSELALVGVMAAVWLVGSTFGVAQKASCIAIQGDWVVDQDAASAIHAAALRGRMLTWFDWGEFLIWHDGPGLRVSMDGRRETVYSDAMLDLHRVIYDGSDGWQDGVTRLAPDYIWLPNRLPVTERLAGVGWFRVYRTDASSVFSRSPRPALPGVSAPVRQCFPG
jgi:hypothetical protein